MKKVLFVVHTSEQTGAPMSVFNLIESLDRRRFFPVVALPCAGVMGNRFLGQGIEVHTFGVPRFGKKEVLRLAAFIVRNGISLVHANSLESYAGCLAGRLTFRPVVWHIHEMLDTYASRVRPLLRLATKVVAVSQSCADAMARFVSKYKVSVIYNGVPAGNCQAEEAAREFRKARGISPDAPLISAIGNIWPGKGYEYLVDAAGMVVDGFPQAKFLIAGNLAASRFENYDMSLRTQIDSLGLGSRVQFVGFVEDLSGLLSASNLVVSSSLVESFGFGLLEAMSYCLPVVATTAGAIPEVVVDGETGLLVPPGDGRALGIAICKVLGDPDFARTLGLNGRKRAEELFSVERAARSFENLYSELLHSQ